MKEKKPEKILYRLSLAFLVLWSLLSLTGCKKQEQEGKFDIGKQNVFVVKMPAPAFKANLRAEEYSYDINFCQDSANEGNLEICLYINEISQQGITYTMVNHSLYTIRYGLEYDLHRMEEGKWKSEQEALKGDYYFSEEASYLEPEQEIVMTDTFKYPVLEQDKYCLVKSVAMVDQNDSTIYNVTINDEFVIE